MKTIILMALTLLVTNTLKAKARIPFGKIDKLEIVANLPDSEEYKEKESTSVYLDLARLHQEFNIAWIIPAWITKEPKLVLTTDGADVYYELTDAQLEDILLANKIDKDKLLSLPFYTRYGGKIVLVLLLGLILYGFFGKSVNEETVQAKSA
ncbi:hypothetical protein [Sphingobacterium sp. LRF_L2]|uniref:hypothetical protein n=1 Tax=Sphingobacterium sp. LRF_L2 TaxID=3369421 RepID=UPI003F60823F